MKILMLTLYLPFPPNSGGQIRSYNLIKNLSRKHEITLVSLIKKGEEKYTAEMAKYCRKVVYFYRPERPWTLTNVLKTAFSLYPFVVVRNFTPEAAVWLAEELKKEKYDLIHVETFYLMPHLPETRVPVLLVDQTIEFEVYRHYVDTYRFWFLRPLLYLDVAKLKFWEVRFWRQAAMVGAVSEADRKKILAEAPAVKVGLVPNAPGEDLARLYYERKPDFEKPVVFYQSNFHWMQNVEGAKILAEKVFPLIKGKVPKAVCYIAGQNARAKVGYLRCDDVTIADLSTEDVAGVVAAYRRGVVFVAPLRGPGGTRLKILGAMTAGVPVVTTSIGAAGLEVTNGQDIIIADSPEAIAAAAGKLLQEREFYRRIAKNARQLVEKKYNWKAISESLNYLYEEIAKS